MGALVDRLREVPERGEWARLKAQAIAAVGPLPVLNVGTYRVTVTGLAQDDDAAVFTLSIARAGQDMTPPDLNPVRVHNPPILVPDPAGEVVRAAFDRDGNGTARRYREDPAAALVEVIADLVRGAMRHG